MEQTLCDVCGVVISEDEDLEFELIDQPPNQEEKGIMYSYRRCMTVCVGEEEYEVTDNGGKEATDDNSLDVCRECIIKNLGVAIARETAKTEREE